MGRMRSSVRVSKLLALMLRHRPGEFGIEVDRYGFADLEAVLQALRDRDSEIEMDDIESVVYNSEKQRFEVVEGRIRARYGHSFPVDPGVDPAEPPEHLYKGVDPVEVEQVLEEGLKPLDRQYVHLSFDRDVAAHLGGRRGSRNAVIRVNALKAHQAGVPFYDCGPTILTPEVPPDYLVLEELPEPRDTPPPPPPPPAPRSTPDVQEPEEVTYGRRRNFGSRR